MKLFYMGVDITSSVSINACYHDMFAEKRSDQLVISFNDTKKLWDKWNPKPGELINIEHGAAQTGAMYIKSLQPENGLFTMRAISAPPDYDIKHSKAWEKIKLLQIGHEIAQHHGLKFQSYGVENQTYSYLLQENVSNFEFLQKRCTLEGCAFLVFDRVLIMYSESFMESQVPAQTLEIGNDGKFEYEDNSSEAFGAAEILSGSIRGYFADPAGSDAGRILTQQMPISGKSEANRYAKGLLRDANKMTRTGVFYAALVPGLSAASVVDLKTNGAASWDGPIFIHHIRHDYVGQISKIFFRKPLEGY